MNCDIERKVNFNMGSHTNPNITFLCDFECGLQETTDVAFGTATIRRGRMDFEINLNMCLSMNLHMDFYALSNVAFKSLHMWL